MGYVFPGVQVELGGGRGWLDAAPAASIRRIDAALGHRVQITEAGRSFFTQEEHWLKYLRDGYPIALNPNTPSEHQKGQAVDSNEFQRNQTLVEEHGWRRTVYRWVNGKWTLVEPWHYEYFAHLDKHINDHVPPVIQEENEMTYAVRLDNKHLFHIGFGQIKHLRTNSVVKGNHNKGPADLTMLIVQPDDRWIDLKQAEFLEQLDSFMIPRSVVDLKTGWVLDVSKATTKEPRGRFVAGGAWSWERAAYQNTISTPVPRY